MRRAQIASRRKESLLKRLAAPVPVHHSMFRPLGTATRSPYEYYRFIWSCVIMNRSTWPDTYRGYLSQDTDKYRCNRVGCTIRRRNNAISSDITVLRRKQCFFNFFTWRGHTTRFNTWAIQINNSNRHVTQRQLSTNSSVWSMRLIIELLQSNIKWFFYGEHLNNQCFVRFNNLTKLRNREPESI